MTIQTCRPLLNVADIEASLGFWRDLIGFEVTTRFESEGRGRSMMAFRQDGTYLSPLTARRS